MGSDMRFVPVQQRLGRHHTRTEAAHAVLDRADGPRASRQLQTSRTARHVCTLPQGSALIKAPRTLMIINPARSDPSWSVGTRSASGASLGATRAIRTPGIVEREVPSSLYIKC